MWKKATEYQRRKRRGWWGKDRVDPDTIMHRIASRAPGEARHAINFSLLISFDCKVSFGKEGAQRREQRGGRASASAGIALEKTSKETRKLEDSTLGSRYIAGGGLGGHELREERRYQNFIRKKKEFEKEEIVFWMGLTEFSIDITILYFIIPRPPRPSSKSNTPASS